MDLREINANIETNGNYSVFNAHFCIFLSELAYKRQDYVNRVLEPFQIHQPLNPLHNFAVHHIEGGDTQCFVLVFGSNVFVTFRGTEYNNLHGFIQDWNTDLNIQQVEFHAGNANAGNVHKGFNDALNTVWENIVGVLDNVCLNIENPRIWFTGHSLGGALAIMLTARFAGLNNDNLGRIAGCYTFGAPMCGNANFQMHCDNLAISSKIFRFENNNDIVPSAPFLGGHPASFIGRIGVLANAASNILFFAIPSPIYRHVGALYYIDRHGSINNDSSHLSRRIDYTVGGLTGGALLDKLLDHRHKKYFEPLRENNQEAHLIPDIPDPLTPGSTCAMS